MKNKLITLIVIVSLYYFFADSSLLYNIFEVIDKNRVFPQESSIFTFKPTVIMGNGEHWVYGEDKKNYYYKYTISYSISKDNQCEHFNKFDYRTWCEVEIPNHNPRKHTIETQDGIINFVF